MTLTTIILVNAALATLVAYGLHHLLAHGIRSDRLQHGRLEVVELPAREEERIAA